MQKQEIGVLIVTAGAVPRGRILEVVNALGHTRWRVECADESDMAGRLQTGCFHVVLCDTDLGVETWRKLCETAKAVSPVPTLIATDAGRPRTSECAEIIRRCAWEILELPSPRSEVYRLVHDAWRHCTREVSPRSFLNSGTQTARLGTVLREMAHLPDDK